MTAAVAGVAELPVGSRDCDRCDDVAPGRERPDRPGIARGGRVIASGKLGSSRTSTFSELTSNWGVQQVRRQRSESVMRLIRERPRLAKMWRIVDSVGSSPRLSGEPRQNCPRRRHQAVVSGTHAGIETPSGISAWSSSGSSAESPSPARESAEPVRRIRNSEEERSRTSSVSSGITKGDQENMQADRQGSPAFEHQRDPRS